MNKLRGCEIVFSLDQDKIWVMYLADIFEHTHNFTYIYQKTFVILQMSTCADLERYTHRWYTVLLIFILPPVHLREVPAGTANCEIAMPNV